MVENTFTEIPEILHMVIIPSTWLHLNPSQYHNAEHVFQWFLNCTEARYKLQAFRSGITSIFFCSI